MPRYSLLTDTLPSTVQVGGSVYPIATGFRVGIRFEELTRDRKTKEADKFVRALMLYFGEDGIPRNVMGAFDAVLAFFLCGRGKDEEPPERPTMRPEKTRRIYDYTIDGPYIYAAFLDQYGVDLNEAENLHWWKFRAMFTGLRHEHEIVKIIGYRACDLTKIKDRHEKERIRKLQNLYKLPEEATAEDMRKMAGAMFGSMFK